MKLRVQFSKMGPLKFIGHLDIMRYFQKAIRRSGIDIAYSTGFSPHQIMSFAFPLGVGMESENEYFDIEVNSITSSEDMMNRLNEQMAEGMVIKGIRLLNEHAANAMSAVMAASYEVTFRENFHPPMDLNQMVEQFLSSETVIYSKEGKKGIIERDIRNSVYELKVNEKEDGIFSLVDASSSGNVNPTALMEIFCSYCGIPFDKMQYCVLRKDVFTKNEEGERISFSKTGELF